MVDVTVATITGKMTRFLVWSVAKISLSLIPLLSLIVIMHLVEGGHKLIVADDPFREDITHVDLEVDAFLNQSILIEGPDARKYPVLIYAEESENIDSYYPVFIHSFKESENRFISCFEPNTNDDESFESDPDECKSILKTNVFTDHTLIGFGDVSHIDYLYINNSGASKIKVIEGPQASIPLFQDSFYEEIVLQTALYAANYYYALIILAIPTIVWLYFLREDQQD